MCLLVATSKVFTEICCFSWKKKRKLKAIWLRHLVLWSFLVSFCVLAASQGSNWSSASKCFTTNLLWHFVFSVWKVSIYPDRCSPDYYKPITIDSECLKTANYLGIDYQLTNDGKGMYWNPSGLCYVDASAYDSKRKMHSVSFSEKYADNPDNRLICHGRPCNHAFQSHKSSAHSDFTALEKLGGRVRMKTGCYSQFVADLKYKFSRDSNWRNLCEY